MNQIQLSHKIYTQTENICFRLEKVHNMLKDCNNLTFKRLHFPFILMLYNLICC